MYQNYRSVSFTEACLRVFEHGLAFTWLRVTRIQVWLVLNCGERHDAMQIVAFQAIPQHSIVATARSLRAGHYRPLAKGTLPRHTRAEARAAREVQG